jgi:hypothetical protein
MADGPPLSRPEFRRLLGRLSRGDLLSFVAAVWRRRGYAATVEAPATVVVSDQRVERRLYVHRERWLRPDDAPPVEGGVDVVVTTGDGGGSGAEVAERHGADLHTVEDLYELVTYGLDRATAKALLWDATRDASTPLPGLPAGSGRGSPPRVAGAVLLAVAVLAAVGAGAVGVLPDVVPSSPGGSEPTGPAGTTAPPTTAATATGPTTAAGPATASPGTTAAPVRTTARPASETPFAASPVAARPNCERSPREVTRAFVDALAANDPERNRGFHAAWRFLTPETEAALGSTRNLAAVAYTDAYRALLDAAETRFSRAYADGNGTVVVWVTVTTTNGTTSEYRVALDPSRADVHAGPRPGGTEITASDQAARSCWRVDQIRPVRADGNAETGPTAVVLDCLDEDAVVPTYAAALGGTESRRAENASLVLPYTVDPVGTLDQLSAACGGG